MTKKIGIIGAGISGLYLANLLEKNPDYDYKIFEKRSQFDLGQGFRRASFTRNSTFC